MKCCYIWLLVSVLSLALVGSCKKQDAGTALSEQDAAAEAERVKTIRDALTRGMRQMAVDQLETIRPGTKCVVTARMPAGGYRPDPPPPPPGMMQLFSQTIIYNADFDRVSADSLTVRAVYPAGHYKKIEIPKSDILSVHLGN
jgi:hypothetical protein